MTEAELIRMSDAIVWAFITGLINGTCTGLMVLLIGTILLHQTTRLFLFHKEVLTQLIGKELVEQIDHEIQNPWQSRSLRQDDSEKQVGRSQSQVVYREPGSDQVTIHPPDEHV